MNRGGFKRRLQFQVKAFNFRHNSEFLQCGHLQITSLKWKGRYKNIPFVAGEHLQ